MTTGVVDRESWRPADGRRPGRRSKPTDALTYHDGKFVAHEASAGAIASKHLFSTAAQLYID